MKKRTSRLLKLRIVNWVIPLVPHPLHPFSLSLFPSISLAFISKKVEAVALDEAQQTSTDYSVMIQNPPKDAKDPDTWKQFFEEKFADVKVSVVTVAVDNEKRVRDLVERQQLILQIQNLLPIGASELDESQLEDAVAQCPDTVPLWKRILCCGRALTAEQLWQQIVLKDHSLTEWKRDLKDFNVSSVFVTFETEQAQRQVLDIVTCS